MLIEIAGNDRCLVLNAEQIRGCKVTDGDEQRQRAIGKGKASASPTNPRLVWFVKELVTRSPRRQNISAAEWKLTWR